ncbi:hypothetical protein H0A43_02990 [Arcobacter lanthieri]|uniref:hypothetical protein n=1 Tax=Aliarcobacter lanthieri TaxID=1355374 RepID=UPI001921C2FF|nr:hypothetical protein [Aliarcobacter lanthieri]MBL3519422.1 hypothetical protein [Aliarcobacter lanthieri]
MSSKYFFTEKYCSCPLNSLSPDEIKKSYTKKFLKYDIKRTTFYQMVSKTLGFQDWGVYQKEYINKILPFLEKNGLKEYAPNHSIELYKAKHDIYFSYRKIADRIFLSDKGIPNKIFTGYRCKTDNFAFYSHFFIKTNNKIFQKISDLNKEDIELLIKSDRYNNILEEQELDYLIPIDFGDFISLMNLVGDTFIIDNNTNKKYVSMTYENNIGLSNQNRFQEIGNIIHNQLKEIKKGWIEIIPFNNNLVFLKADDGYYDFVFRNLREQPFNSELERYIKTKNIPSLVNEYYDFDRWLYFGFKEKDSKIKNINPLSIWLERDTHLAEIDFYKNNYVQNYPELKKILKDYFTKEGKYSYFKKSSKIEIDGFKSFIIEDKILYVSDLITIKEFKEFYLEKDKDNQCYKETRLNTLENLSTVNDEDDSTPVSVTWFDAIAYCRYIENKYNVHTRLLFQDEYKMICPDIIYMEYDKSNYEILEKYLTNKKYNPFATDIKNELNFYYEDTPLSSPPPYMNNFDNVVMKLAKPLEYVEKNDLKFCISCMFNEWTNEFNSGYAIVVSARYPSYYQRGSEYSTFLASSTMKYKYRKVGFRVCYELSKDEL